MTLVNPRPTSVVLDATHILLIRINAAQIGELSMRPSGWLERQVELELQFEEALKGVVELHPNDRFRLSVIQSQSGSPRRPVGPGIWSNIPLDEGIELLAFCRYTSSHTVETLLEEGTCQQLMPAQGHMADVRLALGAEATNLSPVALLELATQQAGGLGGVFTEYLWAKVAEPALSDINVYELLMKFIGLPALSLISRWALMSSVYSEVAHSTTASLEHVHRLAVAMFRLIEIVQDRSVTDNIIRVFLPNLLGLQGGLSRKEADAVFQRVPDERGLKEDGAALLQVADERQKAERTLRDYKGSAPTQELLMWLSKVR